jgi:hypothetical protein
MTLSDRVALRAAAATHRTIRDEAAAVVIYHPTHPQDEAAQAVGSVEDLGVRPS